MSRPRLAVSVAFLAFGAAAGSWVPRLPSIKERLGLSDGDVGVALLLYSAGAVVGASAARFLLARGSRFQVRVGTVALCAAMAAIGLAESRAMLYVAVLAIGLCAGFIDVLENAQAAELEHVEGRPLINGLHGFWSVGAMVGSVSAGAAAFAGIGPMPQLAVAAVVIAALSAWWLRELPDTRSAAQRAEPEGAGRMWLTGAIAAVAVIAFCSILTEGGTADWSAIYLRELSHANAGVAAAGFAGFSLAAALVRFRADRLTSRFGAGRLARLGALTAVLGVGLAIGVPAPAGAIPGFALAGVGVAVLVPLSYTAAANLGRSGTALSIVIAAGYAGSIAGPALIGATADRAGLRVAMAIPLTAGLVVAALAPYLGSSKKTGSPALQ
ncbi:MAG TPA: MFS transporter [Stellaceae bacterium]|nr:MFS transporter [Stellaceae bacterium]